MPAGPGRPRSVVLSPDQCLSERPRPGNAVTTIRHAMTPQKPAGISFQAWSAAWAVMVLAGCNVDALPLPAGDLGVGPDLRQDPDLSQGNDIGPGCSEKDCRLPGA